MSDNAQPTVLTGVNNDLQLEMKISKQEVVDMIVQEREDELEAQSEKLDKQLREHKNAGAKLLEGINAAARRIGDSKADVLIEGLKILYPNHPLKASSSVAVQKNSEYDEETETNKSVFTLSETEKQAAVVFHGLTGVYYIDAEDEHFFKLKVEVGLYEPGADTKKARPIANLPVLGVTRDELLIQPEFTALAAFATNQTILTKAKEALDKERRSLAATGKRAKAKLVRQMLESTENGKAILAGVRKVGKLSLLSSGTPAPEAV